jgi:hypothetical protein
MAGQYPKSAWKVFFLVVALLALALILLTVMGEG